MELADHVGEAMRGASIEVPTPSGTIKVKMPAGAQSGQQLRIKGKGVAAHGQTPAGDLYLRLMVRVPNEKIAQEVIDKIDRAYGEDVRKTFGCNEESKDAAKISAHYRGDKNLQRRKIFVNRLEQEQVISPIVRRSEKFYSIDQVDRVRVARLLIEEMGVNLEGAEVALNMREQMIAMQRQFNEILRLLGRELRK